MLSMTLKPIDSEHLYSKVIPVSLRITEKEERKCSLRITLEFLTNHNHRKELYIQLTDDFDPLLFFSLRLTEDDFQTLKNQQGLLVDFHAFPQQLVQLLEKCLTESTMELPRFLLKLLTPSVSVDSRSHAVLEVVETNSFKHLCHISIQLMAGNDMQLKQYLSTCLKKLKEEKESLSSQLQSVQKRLESEVQYYQELSQQKSTELDRINLLWKEQEAKLNTRLAEEVGAEREKAITTQSELQHRLSHDIQETEHRYQQKVQKLEQRINAAEGKCNDLVEQKNKNEATIRELKQQISNNECENQALKKEVASLRQMHTKLDTDYHGKERALHQLHTQVAVLTQEVKDKGLLLQRQEELLNASNKDKHQMEDLLGERLNVINRREASLKSLSDELMKANEIIKKLQGEMRNLHTKMKLKSQVNSEQEKLLSQKDKELNDLRETERKLRIDLEEVQKGEEKLQDEMKEKDLKMEEVTKQIKTNENVIGWLNRQLNELQVNKPRTLGPGGDSTLSNTNISSGYNSLRAASLLPPPLSQSSQITLNGIGGHQQSNGSDMAFSRPGSVNPLTSILRKSVTISPIVEEHSDRETNGNESDTPLDRRYFEPSAPQTERPTVVSKGLMRTTLNQVKKTQQQNTVPIIKNNQIKTKVQSKVHLNSAYFPNRRPMSS